MTSMGKVSYMAS